MMKRILSLGITAMALAALAVSSTGCTGDDDDDDDDFVPGGVFNVTIDAGGASSTSSYAEFYTDFVGTFGSLRDVPLDTCINPLAGGTSGTPTYADVGATVSAASGGTTLTYDRMQAGSTINYMLAADVAGAPDDADYTATVSGSTLGTISVPPLPGTVAVTGGAVTWTQMGADDAFVLLLDNGFTSINLCHVGDDGSFTIPSSLGLTSGLVAVAGANYAEADLNGRDVLLIGQAGDPANDLAPWGP